MAEPAPAPLVTVCRSPERPPDSFVRSVFLAAGANAEGATEAWATAAVELLKVSGFDDGVVFIGDDRPEPGRGDWRSQAVLLSDAIVCFVLPGSPPNSYMSMEIARWAETGKLFCGCTDEWASSLLVTAGVKAAATLDELMAATWKMVGKGARRRDAEREVTDVARATCQPTALTHEHASTCLCRCSAPR